MNLEKCEPKKYTTEELKEIKTDLVLPIRGGLGAPSSAAAAPYSIITPRRQFVKRKVAQSCTKYLSHNCAISQLEIWV